MASSVTEVEIDDTPPSGSRTPYRSSHLPPGCVWGPLYTVTPTGQPEVYSPSEDKIANLSKKSQSKAPDGDSSLPQPPDPPPNPVGRLIWVDFPPSSPSNPFHFSRGRKLAIVAVATYFTGITAYSTSAYSIGIASMTRELGNTQLQAAAGLALYAWGFGIAPMVLAPLSEEYGRKWTYFVAVVAFTVLHLMLTLGKNIATVLVGRFFIGTCGSLGATLVGGTISDIYVPEERGFPMALFALMAMFFTGLGPVVMCWVEARPDLGWRWIQWIEMIAIGAYIPLVVFVLSETRAPVIVRRKAAKLRKERGMADGGRYTARSEIGRLKFLAAMSTSLLRPLQFLCVEPIVTFFSVWISLAWGVFYTQIFGLPYLYPLVYGFSITQTGLIYLTICIGSVIGFGCNFIQDAIYRKKVAKKGVEARLYASMTAGILLPLGCILYAFTIRPDIHWVVPSIGVVIIIACVITLYITGFVYLAECYGSYASSALAGMSFTRNMFAGAFSMFTRDMYESLTPRWALFLMGMVAAVLGVVPFVAYWKGPEIRARSKYSKILMAEEAARVAESEKEDRERAAEEAEDAEYGLGGSEHTIPMQDRQSGIGGGLGDDLGSDKRKLHDRREEA